MLQDAIFIAAAVFVLLFIVRTVLAIRGRCSPEMAHAEVKAGALLVDVRTAREFASGSIPDARNVPLPVLGAKLSELEPERPIVVFCASGMRSSRAASILRAKGFTVHDLGPLTAW